MAPRSRGDKTRRFRPPTPPPPRRRLPVKRRAFWAGIAVGLGVSAAFLVLVYRGGHSLSPSVSAPWGADRMHLRVRLRALGLPVLAEEGKALHTHEHLDLYVNGMHLAVPAEVGIGPGGRFFSPIHTHDRSGILHVESPARKVFTLGQFFGVWGVRLDSRCIGAYCARDGRTLVAFVGGTRVHGDPAQIPLQPYAEIVLAFGTRAELPQPVPSSYGFPTGY